MVLEGITGFIVVATSQPVKTGWVLFGVILAFIIIFSLKHFLDIAIDAWRLPFAIGIDAMDLLAYDKAYLDITAAAAGFALFWVFSKKGNIMSKLFGVLVAAEAMIGFYLLPQFAFVTNILPLATVLTFVLVKRN